MREYANLQLRLDERTEAAHERIVYVITAHMDSLGLVPCGKESAERIVSFARVKGGFAIYDDCVDRLDVRALDGLACCLTSKLHTCAIGTVVSKDGRILRLYGNGVRCDTFITPSRAFRYIPGRMGCHGHAIRWRAVLRDKQEIRALSAAFLLARQHPEQGFDQLRQLLSLGETATYGFASIEDAGLDVMTLYFHAANRIRQPLLERFLRLPARCGNAMMSALLRRRCRQGR